MTPSLPHSDRPVPVRHFALALLVAAAALGGCVQDSPVAPDGAGGPPPEAVPVTALPALATTNPWAAKAAMPTARQSSISSTA